MKAYTNTLGRRYEEKEDVLIEDPFLSDYCKIMQSKAYRRLAHKTQVISVPDNPHVRTRATHTDEVVTLSIAISEKLKLNTRLCMAIAAGHDIGHTPYGHVGEKVLQELGEKPFKHNINGVFVAQHIERKGRGLNLTYETLNGILNHARGDKGLTVTPNGLQEYSVVMFADKIAYTFSDLNDAVRYGHLKESEIPKSAKRLGNNQRERINNTIDALISESEAKELVQFSDGNIFKEFSDLRKFMFEKFYFKVDYSLQTRILHSMYEFFYDNKKIFKINPVIAVSLLTDREANFFGSLLLQSKNPTKEQISHFGLFEILGGIENKRLDYTDPDLDWKKKY